jgi:FkbM family methyltransferase
MTTVSGYFLDMKFKCKLPIMKKLLLNFIDAASKYRNFFRSLTVVDAVKFSICNALGKRIAVKTTIDGVSLWLRTCTPDYEVAQNALVFGEYKNIKSDAPRVIIDGGANIGTSSIAFARRWPEAKVFAVEMEAENFKILSDNTKAFQNIKPIQAALAANTRPIEIFDRHTGPWGYTIVETTNAKQSTGQLVGSVTLDDLMQQYNLAAIDILKLDIEGAEKEIFLAGGEWINKTKIIAIELHDQIYSGCDRAFYLATRDYSVFERNGEKVTAYR